MKCSVCGMTNDGNPAHDDDYEGPGKHDFKSTAKSYGEAIFVAPGGVLKSLDNGEFDGLMIAFDTVDLTRDAFSKSTELFHKVGDSIPILYDHGLDKTLKRRQIGRATIKSIDDVGVWIKGQLEQRDDYEKAIYHDLVKPGKAGLSSGAASHMVERKKSSKKGVNDIVSWGLAEVSITPRPTEPHTFVEVKSLAAYFEENFDDSHDFLKSVWELRDMHSDCLKHCGHPEDHVDNDPEKPLKGGPGSGRHAGGGSTGIDKGGVITQAKFKEQHKDLVDKGFKHQGFTDKGKGTLSTAVHKYEHPDGRKVTLEVHHVNPRKSVPGSTLGLPNKPHEFDEDPDDEGKCIICGEDEDDPKHDGMKSLPEGRPLKGIFEEELADQTLSIWQIRSALDKVCTRIAAAAATRSISGVEINTREKVTEAVTEYAARIIPLITTQIEDYVESQNMPGNSNSISNGSMGFYLKSLPHDFHSSLQQFVALKSTPVTGETVDSHSARAVSAVEELAELTTGALTGLKSWVKRVKDKIEFRHNDPLKAGRTISAATHNKLQAAHQSVGTAVSALSEVHSHIGGLIELAKRKPGEKTDESVTDDDADAKSLSYEQIELMLTTAQVQTELALTGETL